MALSVKRAFLGDFAKSATILQPEVSIGKSLKTRKRPPILGGFSFLAEAAAVVEGWWRSGRTWEGLSGCWSGLGCKVGIGRVRGEVAVLGGI